MRRVGAFNRLGDTRNVSGYRRRAFRIGFARCYRPRVPLHMRRSARAFRSTCWTCLENLKLQPFPLARQLRSPDCVRAAVEPGFAGRALNLDIRSAGSMVIASMKPIGASM